MLTKHTKFRVVHNAGDWFRILFTDCYCWDWNFFCDFLIEQIKVFCKSYCNIFSSLMMLTYVYVLSFAYFNQKYRFWSQNWFEFLFCNLYTFWYYIWILNFEWANYSKKFFFWFFSFLASPCHFAVMSHIINCC